MSLCHKLWFYNSYIFGIQCRKSLIFQTYIIWSNRIHSLKYLRSTTLESKDIWFRKAEFVTKTQFLCKTSQIFPWPFKVQNLSKTNQLIAHYYKHDAARGEKLLLICSLCFRRDLEQAENLEPFYWALVRRATDK